MHAGPIWLGAEDLEELFELREVIESQRRAFAALADGSAQLAPRLLLPNPADGSVAFCYTSRLSEATGPVAKFGSVNPRNRDLGLPSVSAVVLVLDPVTGQPRAFLDGEAITTARTSAASALAAQLLNRSGPAELAILGCGVQGKAHARSLAATLPVTAVRMWSPSNDSRRTATTTLEIELGLPVRPADDPRSAIEGADIVVTATTSTHPVLDAAWVHPGTTVLSVGSFAPDRNEVGDDLVRAATTIVVDHPATAQLQAGPIVGALRRGIIEPHDLVGLGEVVNATTAGRRSAEDIVFYNSVGLGIQDAAAAWLALDRAVARGCGVPVGDVTGRQR
jgi:ornithine cyclodeaminase/alanine dehydrogenase-like protein (mu-crystallin family)